jgi:hypothetical protein
MRLPLTSRVLVPVLALVLFLVACDTPQASREIVPGAVLLQQSFADDERNAPDYPTWDEYILTRDVTLGIIDQQYTMTSTGGGYIWGLNDQTHSDVIIEVTAEPLNSNPTLIYGVMCRAHPLSNNMGYYFLLRGDGAIGIRRGDGERVPPLVNWTMHNAVRTTGANTIRAVCAGDYLAMYVNGTFVAETTYDWLSEGYAGFAINGQAGVPVGASFDDLTIWQADT